MFSHNLVQSLVELFTNNVNLLNTYILDDFNDINDSILENSKNIIYFKTCLISQKDFENSMSKLALSTNKRMYVLSIYLNPLVVKDVLSKYPNLIFYTVYHSSLFEDSNRTHILNEEGEVEYSYNHNFMGAEYISKLFRKFIFNYFDDD